MVPKLEKPFVRKGFVHLILSVTWMILKVSWPAEMVRPGRSYLNLEFISQNWFNSIQICNLIGRVEPVEIERHGECCWNKLSLAIFPCLVFLNMYLFVCLLFLAPFLYFAKCCLPWKGMMWWLYKNICIDQFTMNQFPSKILFGKNV